MLRVLSNWGIGFVDEPEETLYRRRTFVFRRRSNQFPGSHARAWNDVALHRRSIFRSWAEKKLSPSDRAEVLVQEK